MKAPRGLEVKFEGFETGPDGRLVAKAAVRVKRFWLPWFAAEMVEPWWAKAVIFVWAVWRFWVRRVDA